MLTIVSTLVLSFARSLAPSPSLSFVSSLPFSKCRSRLATSRLKRMSPCNWCRIQLYSLNFAMNDEYHTARRSEVSAAVEWVPRCQENIAVQYFTFYMARRCKSLCGSLKCKLGIGEPWRWALFGYKTERKERWIWKVRSFEPSCRVHFVWASLANVAQNNANLEGMSEWMIAQELANPRQGRCRRHWVTQRRVSDW